jgi:hypothetical protein
VTAPEPAPAGTLRRLFLALATLGVAATGVELAILRHWESVEQLVPWIALLLIAFAIAGVTYHPVPARVRAAQAVAAVVAASGLYGMYSHTVANYAAGPLDQRYSATWSTMSTASRWWEAATGGVGPSPLLAPAVLTQIGVCLLCATVAHPALGGERRGVRSSHQHHTAEGEVDG